MTDQIDAPTPAKSFKPTKAAIVSKLLSRPRGASLGDITGATGWQAHSIRAFLTGLRKKGVNLEREQRRDGTSGYRIVKASAVVTSGGGFSDQLRNGTIRRLENSRNRLCGPRPLSPLPPKVPELRLFRRHPER